MTTLDEHKLHIGGQAVDARSGATFETINPATGQPLARVQIAGAEDVDRAVQAAQDAFGPWSQTTGAARGRILRRAADLLRARRDELARLEVLDTGKPIAEAMVVDIDSGADCIEYFAGQAAGLHGEHIDLGRNAFAYTRREPLGVCAGIGAWNYPLQIACWKSAPALACGNTMVFKPSELTPLTALKLAEIYAEAGLPEGVFNVVQGAAETGKALVRHPGVAKVSLTGEVGTGKRVMADAAAGTQAGHARARRQVAPDRVRRRRPRQRGLGRDDGELLHPGRGLLERHPRVRRARAPRRGSSTPWSARTERMPVGDPLDPATQVGALISAEHRAKVESYIAAGKEARRAPVVRRHARPGPGARRRLFPRRRRSSIAARDAMSIVREEIFGPVMAVLTFEGEGEAIGAPTTPRSGSSAGVFTRDLARAHRVIARLQAGTCWINNYNITPIELPFGGYKQSGIGRENGRAAIEHYTQLKSVYVELGDVECPY